jgi:ABC-type dipeptide/oligopeptide/nickel transport system ATPase component
VGETGSGKTLTAMSILQLLPTGARFTGGSIRVAGDELLGVSQHYMQTIRGRVVGTIFQQSRAALNPTRPVVEQVADAIVTSWSIVAPMPARRPLPCWVAWGFLTPSCAASNIPINSLGACASA